MFSVIANDHGPLAQEYSKKGCPVSLRAELWCQMLGIYLDEFVSTGVFGSDLLQCIFLLNFVL